MASVDESTEAVVLDQNEASQVDESCLNDPNYAIICVFLQKFGNQLKIEHPDFVRLQKMIEDTDEGKAEKLATTTTTIAYYTPTNNNSSDSSDFNVVDEKLIEVVSYTDTHAL